MSSITKFQSTKCSSQIRDIDNKQPNKKYQSLPKTRGRLSYQTINDRNIEKKNSYINIKPNINPQVSKFDHIVKMQSKTINSFATSNKNQNSNIHKFSSTFSISSRGHTISEISSKENQRPSIQQESNQKYQNGYISHFRNLNSKVNSDKITLYQKIPFGDQVKKKENPRAIKSKETSTGIKKRNKLKKNYFIETENFTGQNKKIFDENKTLLTDVSRNKGNKINPVISKRESHSLSKDKSLYNKSKDTIRYAFSLTSSRGDNVNNWNSNLTTKGNVSSNKKKNISDINIIKNIKGNKIIERVSSNKHYLQKSKDAKSNYINKTDGNNINVYATQSGSFSDIGAAKPLTKKKLYLNNSYDNNTYENNRQSNIKMHSNRQNSSNYIYKMQIKVNRKLQVRNKFPAKYVNINLNSITLNSYVSDKSIKKENRIKINYYPPEKIIWKYHKYLTKREINELRSLDSEVFYLGEISERIKKRDYSYINLNKSAYIKKPKLEKIEEKINISIRKNSANHIRNTAIYGLSKRIDDTEGDYIFKKGDQINYRYEIMSLLGKGSYGEALKCLDHKTKQYVCIKIIKSWKKFFPQARIEIKILEYIKSHDIKNESNIVNFYSHFTFRNHICLVFELLDIDLYDLIKSRNYAGIDIKRIRSYATDILFSLLFLKKSKIIHCDLKPENILLLKKSKSNVKVIDFGSSCFDNEKLYIYIQSRFYRAPEVILDQGYSVEIDMWSLGCILCELYTGVPIFPGEDEREQLNYIMEYLDIPSNNYINMSRKKSLFFDENNRPLQIQNSNGKIHYPKSKNFQQLLKGANEEFVDFVRKCLKWDPDYRMTPEEGLMHKFICGEMNHESLAQHKQKIKSIKLGGDVKEKPRSATNNGHCFRREKYESIITTKSSEKGKDMGIANGKKRNNESSSGSNFKNRKSTNNMIIKSMNKQLKGGTQRQGNSLSKIENKKKRIPFLNLND